MKPINKLPKPSSLEDWENQKKEVWESTEYKILKSVEEEYEDHKSCGYDIGCVLHSEPLWDKIHQLLESQKLKMEEEKKKT